MTDRRLTDRRFAHPRTQASMVDLEMRASERAREQFSRQTKRQQQIRLGTVVAVGAYGCFQIDQFTDSEGNGQWFTALNGWSPGVGDAVAYSYLHGTPFVLGPITSPGGKWRIIPDPTAHGYLEPAFTPILPQRGRPHIEIAANDFFVRFGSPPVWDVNCIWWHDHFEQLPADTRSYKVWSSGGTGAVSRHAASPHAIKLVTDASSFAWVGITRHAAASGQGVVWARDMWDFYALIAVPAGQTSYAIRVGMQQAISTADPNGLWMTMGTGAISWFVQQPTSPDLSGTLLTNPGSGPFLMRIRCRRDPEALDDADARLVTFQVLGVNPSVEQDTGEMRVLAEHSQSVPTMDNILLDPGISIMAVSTVIAKQVNVDYWGGWSYIGTDAYGLTTA
jgi:hypothetical protein